MISDSRTSAECYFCIIFVSHECYFCMIIELIELNHAIDMAPQAPVVYGSTSLSLRSVVRWCPQNPS
jgi:hypothetical protein